MSVALDLDPHAALLNDLHSLVRHVRRDPRLAHLTVDLGGDADLSFVPEGEGLRLVAGGQDVVELPLGAARTALSWICQLFLADGADHPTVGAFARAVGPRPLRELVAGL